jgi:hypothetical protein
MQAQVRVLSATSTVNLSGPASWQLAAICPANITHPPQPARTTTCSDQRLTLPRCLPRWPPRTPTRCSWMWPASQRTTRSATRWRTLSRPPSCLTTCGRTRCGRGGSCLRPGCLLLCCLLPCCLLLCCRCLLLDLTAAASALPKGHCHAPHTEQVDAPSADHTPAVADPPPLTRHH